MEKLIKSMISSYDNLSLTNDNYLVADEFFAIKVSPHRFKGNKDIIRRNDIKLKGTIRELNKGKYHLQISPKEFFEKQEALECIACKGTGEEPKKTICPDCLGDGKIVLSESVGEHHYKAVVTCLNCQGDGMVETVEPGGECSICEGTTYFAARLKYKGVNYYISYKVLEILKEHDLTLCFAEDMNERIVIKRKNEAIGVFCVKDLGRELKRRFKLKQFNA